MGKTCDFKTAEVSTKAWMRENKIIDKYLNILDYQKFSKQTRIFSESATRRFGTEGRLFFEQDGKAIPNKALFQEIDKQKGITYQENAFVKKITPTLDMDIQNLNLTFDVMKALYQQSSQRKNIENFSKDVASMVAQLRSARLSNSEILENLKCL